MIDLSAVVVLAAVATYLVWLGLACLFAPARAARFLTGFATSPATHLLELVLRLLAGWAFLRYAPRTNFPAAFVGIGVVLVVTTSLLLLVPWRWHRRFAQRAVPAALPFLTLIGIVSLACGGALLMATLGRAG